MLEVTTGILVSASNDDSFNGIKTVLGKYTNIIGLGNVLEKIVHVTNYGQGSIPPANTPAVLLPINGSDKQLVSIGTINQTPTLSHAHDFIEGESWNNSLKYVLVQQNNGIMAYRTTVTTDYYATLPNGEFMGQMEQNRIDNIEQAIIDINKALTIINANYVTLTTAYNAHVHLVVASLGTPTAPTSSLAQNPTVLLDKTDNYPTLDEDTTRISEERYLINDNGKLYSQT